MKTIDACLRFVDWLTNRVVAVARGDDLVESPLEPEGRFWLGRLSPQESVVERGLGERGERLDPCAIGFRVRVSKGAQQTAKAKVSVKFWNKSKGEKVWKKHNVPAIEIQINIPAAPGSYHFGDIEAAKLLASVTGSDDLALEVLVEVKEGTVAGTNDVTVQLVNISKKKGGTIKDTNFYETSLSLEGVKTIPFTLAAMPDSFRYNRSVEAYGINCGVGRAADGAITTLDAPFVDKNRPTYWNMDTPQPNFEFAELAKDATPAGSMLLAALRSWGNKHWSADTLVRRAKEESWSTSMVAEGAKAREEFLGELERLQRGLDLLKSDATARTAFTCMNAAMHLVSKNKPYKEWRPYQFGFLLSNLDTLISAADTADVAEIIWFATGGGKTETYLGLLIAAAFYDRLSGKTCGTTAWSRFPLRLLSLQQTQRFADALAAAELVRRDREIPGEPFSVGFFVGQGATPNKLVPESPEGAPDVEDESMPARYQVLLRCPFCASDNLKMGFNRRLWTLEHRCENDDCPWPEEALPFYIVDDEIYRFLPTVIVGTLDKAAMLSMQAAMRGMVASPRGICSEAGHGFVYATRSSRPTGCLVPGCLRKVDPLLMPADRYAPTFRLQDELHLLKDSLGAVDAHYEALYDGLQQELSGRRAKILASSATLAGYEKQVSVLYNRKPRVFPVPGPSIADNFWAADSEQLMRRYVALAPRGVTIEYMIDNLLTVLQGAVRYLVLDPAAAAKEIGVPESSIVELVSLYGTNVVYGNTLRDLDAVERSLETNQVRITSGQINKESLTGKQEFETVRNVLHRLENPEADFQQRLHVITASSMMSHGVDIDRLNTMCMLGMPLTTSEFIQATARVGRRWPGLVFVAFKMARERDAAVYRLFYKYVEQGDRFIEPVPVTRRSRRVLDRTTPGLEFARILMSHEPASGTALSSPRSLRAYLVGKKAASRETELEALVHYLHLTDSLSERLRGDLRQWLDRFFRNLENPTGNPRFIDELSPTKAPMRSLRDVEEQAPIYGKLSE